MSYVSQNSHENQHHASFSYRLETVRNMAILSLINIDLNNKLLHRKYCEKLLRTQSFVSNRPGLNPRSPVNSCVALGELFSPCSLQLISVWYIQYYIHPRVVLKSAQQARTLHIIK